MGWPHISADERSEVNFDGTEKESGLFHFAWNARGKAPSTTPKQTLKTKCILYSRPTQNKKGGSTADTTQTCRRHLLHSLSEKDGTITPGREDKMVRRSNSSSKTRLLLIPPALVKAAAARFIDAMRLLPSGLYVQAVRLTCTETRTDGVSFVFSTESLQCNRDGVHIQSINVQQLFIAILGYYRLVLTELGSRVIAVPSGFRALAPGYLSRGFDLVSTVPDTYSWATRVFNHVEEVVLVEGPWMDSRLVEANAELSKKDERLLFTSTTDTVDSVVME